MSIEAPWFRLISLGALAIVILGGLGLLLSDRTNYCEMTYMFEYPKFVHINIPGDELFPQYSLYAYSEGRLTEKVRKMRFDGIPVLYIPGNSGSQSQSRSLASVALRMAISDGHDFHFDYYAVTFNEELSGLYGGVLDSQTKFVALAMNKILSLYQFNRHHRPKAVILIGHSMGGVIAKRLLVHPQFEHMTNIAVTLAAPVAAPVINADVQIDEYYLSMEREWRESVTRDSKVLLSFGGGFRDFLVPSSLTASNDSDFSALTTAIPGVWTSTDHLDIVWCRQFMIAFTKFMHSIVDGRTMQITEDKSLVLAKAKRYFQANRSKTISEEQKLTSVNLDQDAFWYEDNRRIFQISRPNVSRLTYLMIRLTAIHLDRFAAIETIGHKDNDWLFGCTASNTDGNQRTCARGESLSSLARWTPAAHRHGRRKLATVHLHDLTLRRPQWTHVLVRIPPTKDSVTLNIDVNDFASRNLTVDLNWDFSFGKTVVKDETQIGAVYYELLLPGLTRLYHVYLLYIEPTESCRPEYHVSAEMHVPWASNHQYHHFFTHLKKSPMKLQLFTSSPHVFGDSGPSEHVKVTLLLDPQCTFKISLAPSRYLSLGQLIRQHAHVLLPYMAAILLLAARDTLLSLKSGGCRSLHSALAAESLKPYFTVVLGCVGSVALTTQPLLSRLLDTSGMRNAELRLVGHSVISAALYMAALGAVNVLAATALAAVVFCSQLAHRMVLRLVWRGGGGGVAEKLASVLRRVPALVSAALVCAAPASCGAAALAAGAAFYAFVLSKKYEEYLEDYAYKLLAKIGTKIRRYFKSRWSAHTSEDTQLIPTVSEDTGANEESSSIEKKDDEMKCVENTPSYINKDTNIASENEKDERTEQIKSIQEANTNKNDDQQLLLLAGGRSERSKPVNEIVIESEVEIDQELSGLNFHFTMFFLWTVVAVFNVPALLTWARNFKHSMVLRPDTSFIPGVVMSVCAGFLWQISSPRRNLKHYDALSKIIYAAAIVVIVMGPLASYYVSYIVMIVFALITAQQLCDSEIPNAVQNNLHEDEVPSEQSDIPCTSGDYSSEKEMFETLKNMREKSDFTDEADLY